MIKALATGRPSHAGCDAHAACGERNLCWICLCDDNEEDLVNPCACPADRVVHKKCLARWQLQSAGKSEEHACRFCGREYPSWKESLTPDNLPSAVPVVSVHYNGVCYKLRVKPGPEGFASFQQQLHRITGLPELQCMQITFQCRAPGTAQELSFAGISAFDAAIHCAAISAAERQQRMPKASVRGPGDASSTCASTEGGSQSSRSQEQSPLLPASPMSTVPGTPAAPASLAPTDVDASLTPWATCLCNRMPRLRASLDASMDYVRDIRRSSIEYIRGAPRKFLRNFDL